jgi:transcriptional regulator with XRE-family HTH domain
MTDSRDPEARSPIRTSDFFQDRLAGLRDQLGWTQADLGRFFGVSRVAVANWETRGVGETEPRKAALRLVDRCREASPAPGREVGAALLRAGVARFVTTAVHRSPRLGEGAVDEKVGPKEATRIRGRLGWSQAELAAFSGVTRSVPAVWEDTDEDGPASEAVRAALLALRLVADPELEEYPGPDRHPMETLRTEGLSAFYRAVAHLEVAGPAAKWRRTSATSGHA